MKYKFYQPQAIYELGQRTNQEDFIFPERGKATPATRYFILCDGMGGHEKGEVASQTIALALNDFFKRNTDANKTLSDDALLEGLQEAWQKLNEKDSTGQKKMGTTLCLLCFHRGGCTALHIGDSRIYHVRPSEGEILYRSRDHSLVTDLYAAGELSYEEMLTSPQKNIITKALMAGQEEMPKPAVVHIADIRPGDYFYTCSDGMMEQMSDEELVQLLSAQGTDEKKRQQLIASTMDNSDNHSAYLIHVEQVINEVGDERLPNDEQTSRDNFMHLHPAIEESQAMDVQVVQPSMSSPSSLPDRAATRSSSEVPRNPKSHIWMIIAATIVVVAGLFAVTFIHKDKQKANIRKMTPIEIRDDRQELPEAATTSEKQSHETRKSNAGKATQRRDNGRQAKAANQETEKSAGTDAQNPTKESQKSTVKDQNNKRNPNGLSQQQQPLKDMLNGNGKGKQPNNKIGPSNKNQNNDDKFDEPA